MSIDGGATLWARQTIDSDIFFKKPHVWFKIWFYLINEANHKDNKQFKRGNCFMKYKWIMIQTKANRNEIDHCIRWLKSATMITTRKATGGFIVEVLNYNTFQRLESYKSDTKSDSRGETKAKQKRNKSETKATPYNKYDNNDNNEKNEKNDKKLGHTFEKCEVVYQLTIYLGGKIRENNEAEQKKYENFTKLQIKNQIQSWCKDIDKLLRIDKANPDEVKRIIDWIVEDDFWSPNVLSANKLRKHYSKFYKKVISKGKSIKQMAKDDPFDWGEAIGGESDEKRNY